MSSAELASIKLNLIAWIDQLSDTDVISFLDGLRASSSKGDWWKDLSPAQKKQVLSGLKDAEAGSVEESRAFWDKLKNA